MASHEYTNYKKSQQDNILSVIINRTTYNRYVLDKSITVTCLERHWKPPTVDQCLTCQQMNEEHSEQNAHSRPAVTNAL